MIGTMLEVQDILDKLISDMEKPMRRTPTANIDIYLEENFDDFEDCIAAAFFTYRKFACCIETYEDKSGAREYSGFVEDLSTFDNDRRYVAKSLVRGALEEYINRYWDAVNDEDANVVDYMINGGYNV